MACKSLDAGRKESCKDQVGGLKAIYFIDQTQTDFDLGDYDDATHSKMDRV